MLAPPLNAGEGVVAALRDQGYAIIDAAALATLARCAPENLHTLQSGWNQLPPDPHLKDGGRYRRRRHSCFVVNRDQVSMAPHRAHWQPLEYNALHGGMQRWFEPMAEPVLATPEWTQLLLGLSRLWSRLKGVQAWYVEAHQFRIDTTDGIGRPTPEGAHRDGVDFVVVILIERHQIKGGETRVFQADGRAGERFTLTQPWSALLLDDERVIHESTPIQPTSECGYRDTLVLTYRRGGFQGDDQVIA